MKSYALLNFSLGFSFRKFGRLLSLEASLVTKQLTSRDFCSNFQWMTRAQMRKCRLNPKAVIVVGQGTYQGLQECQMQFKNYRWNCTGRSTSWRLFEKMNKKRELFSLTLGCSTIDYYLTSLINLLQ